MIGDLVVCKDVSGMALVRVVWKDTARLIFIHTEEEYDAHKRGATHREPVGFPKEDVFIHQRGGLERPEWWKVLRPYLPSSEGVAVPCAMRK